MLSRWKEDRELGEAHRIADLLLSRTTVPPRRAANPRRTIRIREDAVFDHVGHVIPCIEIDLLAGDPAGALVAGLPSLS